MTFVASRVQPLKRPILRRPGMTLASIGLVALSVAVFSTVYARAGQQAVVLGIGRPVPMGQPISAADLTEFRIGPSRGLESIPAGRIESVVGRRAVVPLLSGTLLTEQEVGSAAVPVPGSALVGIGLRPNQLPASGVAVGDYVDAVLTGGVGNALAPRAEGTADSSSVQSGPGSLLASGVAVVDVTDSTPASSSSPVTVVTLEVPRVVAPLLAAASTAGEVALVVVGPEP